MSRAHAFDHLLSLILIRILGFITPTNSEFDSKINFV